MSFIDTHCHIHEADYPYDADKTLERARQADVGRVICVGTNERSSREAVQFATNRNNVYAAIGVHPHDSKNGFEKIHDIARTGKKIVAIGEVGLDYYYMHSSRDVQIRAFEEQISVALSHKLPIIFHVRDAYNDFWPVLDNFQGIRGVLHSYTDNRANLDEGLKRGLYIGLNGISTFTKEELQKELFSSIPLERLLIETDAPFLTPVPYRGKVNEPAFVRQVAEHQATIRGLSIDAIAAATTANANALFALNQTDI